MTIQAEGRDRYVPGGSGLFPGKETGISFYWRRPSFHGYHHHFSLRELWNNHFLSKGERMSSAGSLTRFVHELRSPDQRQRDEAARIIWERFAPRLRVLVRRHLDGRILRREDEQDILQSMFASFYQGQSTGKAAPASRQELWRLLVRITMCKVVNTANRHMAIRRDVRKERSDRPGSGDDDGRTDWMLDHIDRHQSSPDERVAVVEEVERLLQLLPQDLRQIVLWRLEGFTNAEISQMIGKTVRSVELKLQLIRKMLEQEFDHLDLPLRQTPSHGSPETDAAKS
jgi:RNA polymerase sigma-70 factor, ECF subfamily